MIHEILPVGMLRCNCSVFGDEITKEAVVVDPGDDIETIREILDRHGLHVRAIVITHAHIDHIGGAAKLKHLTGAPVFMNGRDQTLYDNLDMQANWLGVPVPLTTGIDVMTREGDRVTMGSSEFEVIHTPGHTEGSLCLWIPAEGKLVSGDTLFFESIGRTDLPGGDSRAIIQSIHEKLLVLPESTAVFPGHGRPTTIAHEREFNPFLAGN